MTLGWFLQVRDRDAFLFSRVTAASLNALISVVFMPSRAALTAVITAPPPMVEVK